MGTAAAVQPYTAVTAATGLTTQHAATTNVQQSSNTQTTASGGNVQTTVNPAVLSAGPVAASLTSATITGPSSNYNIDLATGSIPPQSNTLGALSACRPSQCHAHAVGAPRVSRIH